MAAAAESAHNPETQPDLGGEPGHVDEAPLNALHARGTALLLLLISQYGFCTDDDREMLALSCPVCHGSGQLQQQIPRLELRTPGELEQRLRDYRDGRLAGTAMPRLVTSFSDEDIAWLAQRFGRSVEDGTREAPP